MIQQDFYSGLPSNPEEEERRATEFASFGKYDYEPGARIMHQVGNPPGMTPPGIGSPVMMMNQYGNIQPTYNQYRTGYNPVLGYNPYYNPMYYQQQQQYMQQYKDRPATVVVRGINRDGEYLPPIDYDKNIEQMKTDYWGKYQEQVAQNAVKNSNMNLYNGFNYYGTPYYNPWQYNQIDTEINQKVDEIKQEAKDNRMALNLQLSKLSHGVARDHMPEEVIKERYEGKVIELPTESNYSVGEMYQASVLDNLTEFNNAQFYQEQYQRNVAIRDNFIKKDGSLKETFENIGIVMSEWEMEEEMHRRRDLTTNYNSSDGSYRYFVRRKAQERYARENGIDLPNVANRFDPEVAKQNSLNSFSTLKDSVSLGPDGTLNVTCNVGSHAGEVYQVNDEEQKYKERFESFLGSINKSIYYNNDG